MRTYLDCIPCFFKQALEAARIAGANKATQKKILDEVSKLIPNFPLKSSPPEMGRAIYWLVKKITGKEDPFKDIKEKSNRFALSLYPELKKKVKNSYDRLLTAVRLAITGNVIDYGVKNSLDVEKEIRGVFNKNFITRNKSDGAIFNYEGFKGNLDRVKTILYLADNAGETIFDKILIEELNKKSLFQEGGIIYAVRDKPIINDALIEDACMCGIDKRARVISSGSDAPGTILDLCSQEFLKIYEDAELIISKGQGNFEALSEEDKPIFFLFKVKCPVIAKDVGCEVGSIILKTNGNIRD